MKTRKKPTCFISYCREGIDLDSVRSLVQQLHDASGEDIEFLFDEYLKPGADLPSFMELVEHASGVIVLLTPQYKRKVEERLGGVYKEFSVIMGRYEKELESANRKVEESTEEKLYRGEEKLYRETIASPFCLIPLIFSANFQASCPNEISGKLSKDLLNLVIRLES